MLENRGADSEHYGARDAGMPPSGGLAVNAPTVVRRWPQGRAEGIDFA